MLCLIPGSIECFSLKITAKLVRLYRSCLHFIAFSYICGFFSLLFLLTSTSLQMKTLLAIAISYSILPGPNAGFLLYCRDYARFLYIAKTKLSFSILPGLCRVSLIFNITSTKLGFSILLGLGRVSFGFSH
jgi:hypothetical protein